MPYIQAKSWLAEPLEDGWSGLRSRLCCGVDVHFMSPVLFTPVVKKHAEKNSRETKRVSTRLDLFPTAVCSTCVFVFFVGCFTSEQHVPNSVREVTATANVLGRDAQNGMSLLRKNTLHDASFCSSSAHGGLIPISVIPCLSCRKTFLWSSQVSFIFMCSMPNKGV